MKIIVPKEVKDVIKTIGNKTAQKNAYKIYAALYKREKRKTQNGYFDVPSTFLKSINDRYNRTINAFLEAGIIRYYERAIQGDNLFETVYKKYYNKNLNICMKYKFLIDITQGDEIEIDMDNPNNKRWFEITKNTLINLGYTDFKISRDDFGRRVHHPAIYDYRQYLSHKGLSVIDAKCSQPRLLYLIMKERGIVDQNYFNIFENDIDFYSFLIKNLNIEDRSDAKNLFMFWLNSNGYVQDNNIHRIFPQASQFIKSLKNKNYKDAASFLQREEAKIWIDDLLENLPVDFGLTIHDSLIVKNKDSYDVLEYCKQKYPQIEFDIKEL